MEANKIIRTVCIFSDNPAPKDAEKLNAIVSKLESAGYLIQTKRLASTISNLDGLKQNAEGKFDYTSIGAISYGDAIRILPTFLETEGLAFNIDLAKEAIDLKYAELLFDIIEKNPSKTFNFAFTFNNAPSSPYFPSARYEQNGFAIGMQPTDLAKDCQTLEEWLEKMRTCWNEIATLFADDPEFLGIDSSIAPIGAGNSSFIHFVRQLGTSFEKSVTTDFYTTITRFIKEQNPKPVGLCGMMFPCLEDVELAEEYDNGNFTIERNVFLSLHSGLGIDTYPIGVDEKPERVIEILKLIQALSNKYNKPLSARFASDGKTTIGNRSDYQHPHLTDCTMRAL